MTYSYRKAKSSDSKHCVKILREWADETPWMPELDDLKPMEEFWKGIFENDPTWVAEFNAEIIGFCVRNTGHENNIGALYVVPEFRNCGVGKHLLDLAKEKCSHITVWAYEKNTKARRFYQREDCNEVSREFDEEVNLVDIEHRWKR
jgi:GNAT superfamily N-acetyltransferase